MKAMLNKKINLLYLGILLYQFFLIPILSKAAPITNYAKLEPDAFQGFNTVPTAATSTLAVFLSQAFTFGLAIAAALAVIMIVWGGVQYMLSESLFNKEDGKAKIKNAIWGLLLALVSWLILYTINPNLLKFNI